jgi:hypothetical protein
MAPQLTYYFGRLNIMPTQALPEKKELLLAGLTSGEIQEDHGLNWQFFEIQELDNEVGEFLHGYLGRYKTSANLEIAIPSESKVGLRAEANLISSRSAFYLHIESGLIAYHPIPKQITPVVFKTRFTQLLTKAQGSFFFDAEIDDIDEPFTLAEEIKKFDRITTITIRLHPSNPSNRDIWQKLDERLRKLRVTSYNETYEAKQSGEVGIRAVDDEDIKKKIAMAEDGYGNVRVVGEIRGNKHIVSTSDNPLITTAPSGIEPPEHVLKMLLPAFGRILDRFNK